MDSVPERLARCFQAVFPDIPADRVEHADASTVAAWDSLNVVTLAAVIEEEFGVALDLSELDRFDSYASILAQLQRELARSS